jgi:hypothetical protein
VVGSAKPSGVVPRDDGGELKGEDPSGDVVYIISGECDRGALPILRRADEFFVNFVNGEAVFGVAISVCSGVIGRGGDSSAVAGVESLVTTGEDGTSLLLLVSCEDVS